MVPYRVEPRTRRQRTQPAKIELLEPKQHNNVDEYDVAGRLYPGKLDTDLITKCPMVDAPGAAMPLRDWLKHLVGVDMWPVVVSRLYTRAAADLEIAEPERDATNKRCPLLPDHWPHAGRGSHLPLNASHLQVWEEESQVRRT